MYCKYHIMDVVIEKKRIIEWVESLEDTETIELLKDMANPRKFNFDEEFKKGLTSKEFSKRTTDFLKGLKWEK